MAPTIRIWGISGPLGMIVSGLITAIMLAVGAISVQSAQPDCSGVGFGQCIGAILGSAIGQAIGLIIVILLVFLLLVIAAWFLTGMFAGWQAVRLLRKLEPGITDKQGCRVSTRRRCGSIVAAFVMIFLIGILSNLLGR